MFSCVIHEQIYYGYVDLFLFWHDKESNFIWLITFFCNMFPFCKSYHIVPSKQLCFMLLPGLGVGAGGGVNGGEIGNAAGASRFWCP